MSVPTPSRSAWDAAYREWLLARWPAGTAPTDYRPVMAFHSAEFTRTNAAYRQRRGGYLMTLQPPWLAHCLNAEFPGIGATQDSGGIVVGVDAERFPELASAAQEAADAFAAYHTEGNYLWALGNIPERLRDDDWDDHREAALIRHESLHRRARATRIEYQRLRSRDWGGSSQQPGIGQPIKPARPASRPATTRQARPAAETQAPGTVESCYFCTPKNRRHEADCMLAPFDDL